MVHDGTLEVEASNAIAGDPANLIRKQMRVDYTLDGHPGNVTVDENSVVRLPPSDEMSEPPPTHNLAVGADGKPVLTVWNQGEYTLTGADGKATKVAVDQVPPAIPLSGPWDVTFPPHLGAPASVRLPKLMSWTDDTNPGVKYFSGTAEYAKDFDVPADVLGGDHAVELDLGRVLVICRVSVNGQDLGVLWKPPFKVDITSLVRPGTNSLRVQVTNLWPNRLIGDEQIPDGRDWSGGGSLRSWSQAAKDGHPKPVDGRITWTTWQHYSKDSPLLESGLLGPVQVRIGVRHAVATP